MQKRVVAVHDISCVGRCSITVALPILSAAGIETSILPTAVLSTHTGGFENYTFRDLTDDMIPVMEHWKSLGLKFDAIYTGYLGSYRQLDMIRRLIELFGGEDCLVMIDPVMGDSGKLYPAFEGGFARGMAELCRSADILVPNLTEAALILDEPYAEAGYGEDFIEDTLRKLSRLGPEEVILTGVSFRDDKIGAAGYQASTDSFVYYFTDRIPGYYHGTGDIFASSLLGAELTGTSFASAVKIAVDFTKESILRTRQAGTDVRYGVNFEESLPGYMSDLK